jgi:ATP-dependent helicase/nuclease subunit B
LQQYAKCPFQYFASRVLGLDPVRITALEQLPPQEVGELCHTILRRCGERLIAMGWPRDSVAPDAVRQIVVSLAEEIFGAYTLGHGTGYFVLWQATKETIVRLILASLEEDQRDYRASGFRPVAFEVEAEGVLDAGPSQGEPIKIGGRLDRIDLRDHPPAWRIVDYKYRQDVEKKPKDRDLLTAALRGVALQPPLYARMVPADAPRELSERLAAPLEDVQLKFLAPRWEPVVDRASFPAAYWKGSEAEQLRRTLDHFVDGVRSGRFFIMPGGQCDFCEYSAACRRFDASVAVRTYRSPAAKALRRIQKQKAVRE